MTMTRFALLAGLLMVIGFIILVAIGFHEAVTPLVAFAALVILIGGVMICVPGFIGDALGLLLMIGPVRHLVIRTAGHRLARRVQTVRTDRWRVVSVGSQPVHDEPSSVPDRPDLTLGPGDGATR